MVTLKRCSTSVRSLKLRNVSFFQPTHGPKLFIDSQATTTLLGFPQNKPKSFVWSQCVSEGSLSKRTLGQTHSVCVKDDWWPEWWSNRDGRSFSTVKVWLVLWLTLINWEAIPSKQKPNIALGRLDVTQTQCVGTRNEDPFLWVVGRWSWRREKFWNGFTCHRNFYAYKRGSIYVMERMNFAHQDNVKSCQAELWMRPCSWTNRKRKQPWMGFTPLLKTL